MLVFPEHPQSNIYQGNSANLSSLPFALLKIVINLFFCSSLSLEYTCLHKVDQNPAHYSQELTSLSPCTGCLSRKFTSLALFNLLVVLLLSDHCIPGCMWEHQELSFLPLFPIGNAVCLASQGTGIPVSSSI